MNKIKLLLINAMLAVTTLSFGADDIGATADNISGQVSAVTNLMVVGGTLLGIVFLIVGGLNLKKHGDNPQQVPLSKPLIFLTAGALLFGLGSTSDVMQQSIFGGGRDAGGDGTFEEFSSN